MATMSNQEIARALEEMGELVELSGGSSFRARAYHFAARAIGQREQPVAEMIENGEDLTELPGVGESMAEHIQELVRTGHTQKLDELRHEVAPGLPELLQVPGLGATRVRVLNSELGICTREQLYSACKDGKVRGLRRFGKKLEEKLLHALTEMGSVGKRFPLAAVRPYAEALVAYIESIDGVRQVVVAGSYRRQRETVGDLDIVIDGRNGGRIIARFLDFPDIVERLAAGTTKASVILKNGLQVDIRVVPHECFGAALYYFTGSKTHNVAVRDIALRKGLLLNEYGLFADDKKIAGSTEESIFEALELAYIRPEDRENRGELEAAAAAFSSQSTKAPQKHVSRAAGPAHTRTSVAAGSKPRSRSHKIGA